MALHSTANRRSFFSVKKISLGLCMAALLLFSTGCSLVEELLPEETASDAPTAQSASETEPSLAPTPEPEDLSLFREGTLLGGQNISGKPMAEAQALAATQLSDATQSLSISVAFPNETVQLQGEDFACRAYSSDTLAQLLESRIPGDYSIPYALDLTQAGQDKLLAAAAAAYQEGYESTITGYDPQTDSFSFSEETMGLRVDIDQTLHRVRQLLAQKHGGAVQAALIEVPPTLRQETLAAGDYGVLGSYSTESSNTENGNNNMRLALERINGTVLMPGEVFSYNGTIGDSTTTENGYLPAGGISGGVTVQMVGGGICQGSSTLYGAVIRAGLEVVTRYNHGLESTYCPTGQDAMVDYGNCDFQFRNNYDSPIYIMSGMEGVTLSVSIYGIQPEDWDSIEIFSERVSTTPALETITFSQDNALEPGQYVLRTNGTSGAESVASRTFYKNGAVVRTEALPSSSYAPTGRVYTYGPGTDTSRIDTTQQSGYVS